MESLEEVCLSVPEDSVISTAVVRMKHICSVRSVRHAVHAEILIYLLITTSKDKNESYNLFLSSKDARYLLIYLL